MKYTMVAAVLAGAVMAGGFATPAMADEGPGAAPTASDQEIVEAMEQLCEAAPMDRTECQNYVDVYGNMVIQMIRQNMSLEEIAGALGLEV
ncbi:saposin domain-containing protein [Streptomyces sp. NPDC056309]|uniref:saposin domain-containing protein n=1 Tax=unclassified Streptomyces TaxID=2593676 RepID=UPI0035DF2912